VSPEESLQISVVQYLEWHSRGRYRVLAIPNGGHMSAAMGARRKRMGAKAGAPDLLIQLHGGKCIEIELKTEKGRQSKSQRDWQAESERLGV
jgi:hypothetical protein